MAQVVFMRAVNVGKHQRFSVSALAKQLAALDVVNIGAVGTLVVRKKIAAVALSAAIWKHTPFKPELLIVDAKLIAPIIQAEPTNLPSADGLEIERLVSIVAKPIKPTPKLPIDHPATGPWQVRLTRVAGPLIVSHFRRNIARLAYPNEVIEKSLGVSSTMRNWNTMLKILTVLQASAADGVG